MYVLHIDTVGPLIKTLERLGCDMFNISNIVGWQTLNRLALEEPPGASIKEKVLATYRTMAVQSVLLLIRE